MMFKWKKPDESRSSPKGYLTNTRRSGFDREAGFYPEEIGPGEYALKGPTSREQIKQRMEFLSGWASEFIKSEGESPKDFAKLAERNTWDWACLRATLLVQLRRLADLLGNGAQEPVISHSSCNAGVLAALDIATTLHQMTIVDFETGIDAWQKSKEGASRGGLEKRKHVIRRNREMAEEFEKPPSCVQKK
jgi:hypothetical protein